MTLGSIPVLMTFEGSAARAAERGTILLYHGFTACKESGTKEFQSLAARGFLVVGPDNVGHGERRYPDFDRRFGAAEAARWEERFLEAVRATADEVPQLLDQLEQRGLAHPDRVGISGISMGGYIAYGAMLRDRRLRVAAPILGSPLWNAPDSPHLTLDRFFPAAILSQNAGQDQSVPPQYARDFHWHLRQHYGADPERQRYVEFPDSGHFMGEEDWTLLWANVVGWFDRFLAGETHG